MRKRLKEIKNESDFGYVESKENPADISSHGTAFQNLLEITCGGLGHHGS